MPQFIIGNAMKETADKYPAVRNAIWLIEAAVFKLFFGFIGLLPIETASRLGQRITMIIGPKLKKHKTFRKNIERAFPEKTPAERENILRGIWGNVGSVIGEFPHLQTICHDEKYKRLKIAVAGQIEALQKPGNPVIIVSAHLSNWEVAGAAVAQMGIPCADAYTPMGNPWLDRMIARYRETLGVELFARAESMRPMVKRLASGQSLAFFVDQRVDNGQSVPFMGMDKMTTVVPAKLGLRFNCEIVPIRVERLADAQYLATFYPPVEPDDKAAPEKEKIIQITRKINAVMGEWVRDHPEEWFPSKRRWDKLDAPEFNKLSSYAGSKTSHVTD